MGRLQKKKTSPKKKKQDLTGGEPLKVDAAEKTALPATVSGKDLIKKKEPPPVQKKYPEPVKTAATLPKKSFMDKPLQFLREVKVELKKVTWPTRKQTLGSTAVVIVIVMIISIFLGIVDVGLSSLIRVVFQ